MKALSTISGGASLKRLLLSLLSHLMWKNLAITTESILPSSFSILPDNQIKWNYAERISILLKLELLFVFLFVASLIHYIKRRLCRYNCLVMSERWRGFRGERGRLWTRWKGFRRRRRRRGGGGRWRGRGRGRTRTRTREEGREDSISKHCICSIRGMEGIPKHEFRTVLA